MARSRGVTRVFVQSRQMPFFPLTAPVRRQAADPCHGKIRAANAYRILQGASAGTRLVHDLSIYSVPICSQTAFFTKKGTTFL